MDGKEEGRGKFATTRVHVCVFIPDVTHMEDGFMRQLEWIRRAHTQTPGCLNRLCTKSRSSE